eukprot:TRINITY_DN4852_c0_g1_i1.p1 TRINITY_DN4852_c0_g1~~TRINITY_DN4852_c0_g1_i1.p1  ORF type:complete len:363 (-),score=106.71 TRINITY_DN4852_c0_g1_i1:177-1208(-)
MATLGESFELPVFAGALRPAPKSLSRRGAKTAIPSEAFTREARQTLGDASGDGASPAAPDLTFPTLLAGSVWRKSPAQTAEKLRFEEHKTQVWRKSPAQTAEKLRFEEHKAQAVASAASGAVLPEVAADSVVAGGGSSTLLSALRRAPLRERRGRPRFEDSSTSACSSDSSLKQSAAAEAEEENARLRADLSCERRRTARLESALQAEKASDRALRSKLVGMLGRAADLEGALEAERVLRRQEEARRLLAEERIKASGDAGAARSEAASSQQLPQLSLQAEQRRLAKHMAMIEVGALRAQMSAEERGRMRRRLQAKWHPDKNAHSPEFATVVLQELQQLPEWT